jgi:cobalt-zinc-cadmium efflux system outer membrane protein
MISRIGRPAPAVLTGALVVMSMMAGSAVQAGSPIWAPESVARLIEEALAQNLEIRSLEARVESLEEAVSFAGALDDPRLGFGVMNLPTDSFSFNQEPMTQKQVFIAQKLPWFGKLDLKAQRQALLARRQQAILDARKLELSRKVAHSLYQLGFNAKGLEVNERLTGMVSQLLRVAETKYASGQGLQQDVLQAQVALSRLLNEKVVLQRMGRTLEDQLNELLNRTSRTPVKPPQGLTCPGWHLPADFVKKQALEGNPWLRVRQAEVDTAGVDIELAEKDYWPDMDVNVAYGQREEDLTGRNLPDFFSAGVMINIPLWASIRQKPKLAASRKGYDAEIASYRSLAEALPHRVDSLLTEISETQASYRVYAEALLLQARQWADASLSAYEVGKVEFNTMINAQIQLLSLELEAYRDLTTIYQKRAELEELIGGPVNVQAANGE